MGYTSQATLAFGAILEGDEDQEIIKKALSESHFEDRNFGGGESNLIELLYLGDSRNSFEFFSCALIFPRSRLDADKGQCLPVNGLPLFSPSAEESLAMTEALGLLRKILPKWCSKVTFGWMLGSSYV